MDLKSLKKALYVSLPILIGLGGCSLNKNFPFDPVYYSYKKPATEKVMKSRKRNLETKIFDFNLAFEYGNYFTIPQTYLNWDSDGDGIYDWTDPWPGVFGPFIDMNNNGIIDSWDIQTGENFFPFWNLGWDLYFGEYNFWENYYFPFIENNQKEFYYGPRKGFNHNIPDHGHVSRQIFHKRRRSFGGGGNLITPIKRKRYQLLKEKKFNFPIKRERNYLPKRTSPILRRNFRHEQIPPRRYNLKRKIKYSPNHIPRRNYRIKK